MRLVLVVLSCVLALPSVAAADALADARRLIARGKYADAERTLTPLAASSPTGDAALELGLLRQLLGRRDEARPLLTAVADAGRTANAASTLARAARASSALGQARDAHAFFRDAATLAPTDPAINTAWGDHFLQIHQLQDAVKSFKIALTADPKFVAAHVGLARAFLDDDAVAAAEAAKRALELDPEAAGAHLVLAEIAMDETRRDAARAAAQKALDINPNHFDARAIVAAIAFLEGRRTEYEAEVARILALNPTYGEAFRIIGDHAARSYRFEEAVGLTRRAIMLDLENARAHADLGLHLMRVGDERGARAALERAFRSDPFDVVTFNLLALLDALDKFETVEAGEFVVKFHPDEARVMREYLLPLAQEALKTLSARYGYKPQVPILIEMFPRHDDFAVRNLGLPGLVGALGACFGRVITLDSPRVVGKPPGSFNWGATLWHEMAHVITLQMSRQRVPRWLTEGISVFEEGRARPEWGREMQMTFAEALEGGKVLKLRDLNAGFTRADTIALAYYQASLLVDHIVVTHGEPSLHRLLRAYGQGLEGDTALQSAIGVTMEGLQPGFDAAVEKKFGALRRAVAESNPENYKALMAKARALHKAGSGDEAVKLLQRAAELVPVATGEESPRAILAAIAEEKGDRERAMRELETLLSYDHTALNEARRLVALAEKAKDTKRLRLGYERMVAIDPFDAAAHSGLGRLALTQGHLDVATREFRAALATNPVDLAAAHTDLAEAYLAAGEAVAAKRQVLSALEIAPRYERAQELLLKAAEVRP